MSKTWDRFWAKVSKSDGCWVWSGGRNAFGYGRFGIRKGRQVTIWLSHRLAWELTNGPIPEGKHVHHVCENPACVRPDHLEVVTPREHMLRTPRSLAYRQRNQTHCKYGHPLIAEYKRGSRCCVECRHARPYRIIASPRSE